MMSCDKNGNQSAPQQISQVDLKLSAAEGLLKLSSTVCNMLLALLRRSNMLRRSNNQLPMMSAAVVAKVLKT